MKTLKVVLGGAFLLLVPALSQAEGQFGINYVHMKQHDRFYGDDNFETGDVMLRLAGNINRYWLTELRAGTTASPKKKDGVEFRHSYFYGAMARFQYPVGRFTPYVGAGYSRIKESIDTRTSSGEATFSDFSYAAGVDILLGESVGFQVEYFTLSDEDNVARRGPSAGFYYSF